MLLKCQQLKLSITLKVQLAYLTNLYPNKYLVNCLSCQTIDSFDSYNIFNCLLWNKNIQYTHTHTHTHPYTLSHSAMCHILSMSSSKHRDSLHTHTPARNIPSSAREASMWPMARTFCDKDKQVT